MFQKKSEELEKIADEIYAFTIEVHHNGMSEAEMSPLVKEKVLSYHLTKRKTLALVLILKKRAGDLTE